MGQTEDDISRGKARLRQRVSDIEAAELALTTLKALRDDDAIALVRLGVSQNAVSKVAGLSRAWIGALMKPVIPKLRLVPLLKENLESRSDLQESKLSDED